jgi:hypothetical protein
MARLHDVTFDCHHPSVLARFWADALDGYDIAPYDDAEIARLREMGIDDVADDPNVLVEASGAEPRFCFQLVPESKTVKNRVHLDLRCDDLDAETARLVALGARVLTTGGPQADWVVFADPEGNEFCVSS